MHILLTGDTVAVGVDVAEVGKGLDVVAMALDRSIFASVGGLSVADSMKIIADINPALVCIDSPSQWASSAKSRQAERDLAIRGIQSFRTGADPGEHRFYGWMRVGFSVFDGLRSQYPRYRGGPVRGKAAEIFPHASACFLAGCLRPSGESKAAFRRRVLADHGVQEHSLPNIDRVDAALGALTGLLALEGKHSWVGDPDEGIILLPVKVLPDRLYSPNVTARSRNTKHQGGARAVGHFGASATTQLGYLNRNGQVVVRGTLLAGTDHVQRVYVLRCTWCDHEYGSNGSDNFQRKCPHCQGGRPGLPYG